MQQSPVLQQQLRSLQTLHQSPDGTLYHNQALPELQNLHTNDVYQQQYALSGPPQQQAPSHGLPVHFEQHALSPQGPYQPFQATGYMNAPAQQYHTSPPQPVQRTIQQLPLPPAAPILAVPIRNIDQGQPSQQQEGRDGYVNYDLYFRRCASLDVFTTSCITLRRSR
jgi:glutathione S-transferase